MTKRPFVQYHQRVLATDPIAYWLLDEKTGTVAYDRVSGRIDGAQNGTHVGVTLGQPGIGDGRTSPLYDGANDYTNVQSAALVAAFDGDAGSLLAWVRVANAGVWVDGTNDVVARLEADANNFVQLLKTLNNNQFRFHFRAGGVNEISNIVWSDTDWFCAVMTWDKIADQVLQYLNGGVVGIDDYAGVWAGALAISLIGALTIVPASPWNGYLDHCAVWDRALTPAEIEMQYRARWP